MRRLWMSALLAPVVALAVPAIALAAPAAQAKPAAPVAAGRVAQLGSSSSSVRSLQRRLAALRYYPGPIDGQFGMDTQEAVWAFQEVQGLRGDRVRADRDPGRRNLSWSRPAPGLGLGYRTARCLG